MKTLLSTKQVNENLTALANGKKLKTICYKAYQNWNGDLYYYFFNRGYGIFVVSNKQVYEHKFGANYQIEDYPMIVKFQSFICIPLGKHENELKKQLQTVCGLLNVKADTELNRLQKLAGKEYTRFYKLIKEVNVISAYVDTRKTGYNREIRVLVITHQTGQFAFPIENINAANADEQIQAIFFNLLNLPLNNQTAA